MGICLRRRCCLSLYLKACSASWADHKVLPLGLWKSEDSLAVRTFAVNVSFTVSELVSAELEKSAEAIVFFSSGGNISGEHSEKYPEYQAEGGQPVKKSKPYGIVKDRNNRAEDYPYSIHPYQYLVERVSTVSAVHKTVESVFEFPHLVFLSLMIIRFSKQPRDPSWRHSLKE